MEIVHARSISDAVTALGDLPSSDLLAGGTDLMVEVNFRHRDPTHVVSLRRVDELRVWDGRRLGANVTYRDMEGGHLTALAEAARTVGSPQIRSVGTIGGNLGTASPAGDTLPVLAALDAEVELQSNRGVRTVPLDRFITGVKRTDRATDEVITAAILPEVLPAGQAFAKVGVRNAMVISMVSACAMRWEDGRVALAMGAVAPHPLRLSRVEELLAGQATLSDDLLAEVRRLVSEDVRPITDQRGTESYRRHAAGVLAGRVVERVFA